MIFVKGDGALPRIFFCKNLGFSYRANFLVKLNTDMQNDSNNIYDLYKSVILTEIHSNVPRGGDSNKSGHRVHGRHILPPEPKPEIPSSRLAHGSNVDDDNMYEDREDFQNELEYKPEELDRPKLKDLESMPNELRRKYKMAMAMLRMHIDEHHEESKIKALYVNRTLMDMIINDLMLGFANSTNVKLNNVAENGDPIFTLNDNINIQVEIPYGSRTNYEDVRYLKL